MSAPEGSYVMLLDGDDGLISLLGPVRGGREAAVELMQAMLALDARLAEATEWESEAVCAPYFYHSLRVVELSPAEVQALAKAAAR